MSRTFLDRLRKKGVVGSALAVLLWVALQLLQNWVVGAIQGALRRVGERGAAMIERAASSWAATGAAVIVAGMYAAIFLLGAWSLRRLVRDIRQPAKWADRFVDTGLSWVELPYLLSVEIGTAYGSSHRTWVRIGPKPPTGGRTARAAADWRVGVRLIRLLRRHADGSLAALPFWKTFFWKRWMASAVNGRSSIDLSEPRDFWLFEALPSERSRSLRIHSSVPGWSPPIRWDFDTKEFLFEFEVLSDAASPFFFWVSAVYDPTEKRWEIANSSSP